MKNNAGRWIMGISLALFSLVFLYAAYQMASYWYAGSECAKLSEDLIEKAVIVSTAAETEAQEVSSNTSQTGEAPIAEKVPIEVDFETLWQENEDIVAWIYCADTAIHYPVVQGEDNNYYLRRLLNGKYNINGTIFLDYRSSPDFTDFNSIIYGHHMKSGEMFGTLSKYKEQSYYDAHPVMYLLTPEQSYQIELIAGYITPSDSTTYSAPQTEEDKKVFLENALRESTFVSSVSADETDTFVTLSTCSYEYENARYVVVGKLTRIE